jgi:hypothetical protein
MPPAESARITEEVEAFLNACRRIHHACRDWFSPLASIEAGIKKATHLFSTGKTGNTIAGKVRKDVNKNTRNDEETDIRKSTAASAVSRGSEIALE